jgi:hypothetical protein
MMKWLSLGLLVILSTTTFAEDFRLANGQVVKGDLSRVEPDGLVIMTDAGIEKISFLVLSDETRRRFGFDLKKADAFRAQQAANRQQMLEQQAAAIREQAARLEALQQNQPSLEVQQRRVKIESEAVTATASIYRGTSKGAFAKISVQTGRAARTMLDPDTRANVDSGTAFIYDLRAADGETFRGKLYPAGLYTYMTSSGVERTQRAYALTAEAAVDYERSARATPGTEQSRR